MNMKNKNRHSTSQIEMVETYNIALSLRRLQDTPSCGGNIAQRRAIYHAVCMTYTLNNDDERRALREAMKLP